MYSYVGSLKRREAFWSLSSKKSMLQPSFTHWNIYFTKIWERQADTDIKQMQKQLFSQWQQIGIFRWASLIKLIQEPEPKINISSKTSPEKNKDTKYYHISFTLFQRKKNKKTLIWSYKGTMTNTLISIWFLQKHTLICTLLTIVA